jgi:hypothetical protein
VNPPDRVTVPPSGLVTMTFREVRLALAAIVIVARTCVALRRATELIVIPLPENVTVSPVAKFVPLMVT